MLTEWMRDTRNLAGSALLAMATTGLIAGPAMAEDDNPPDKAPDSMLYDMPQKVADDVWSAIGATQPYTYENSLHNNNLSFVIGEDAVLVMNAGASYQLAEALHEEIKKRTDVPVKYVVNENGQLHAAMATGYWIDQGAEVIAHVDAAEYYDNHKADYLDTLQRIAEEKAEGTDEAVSVSRTFEDRIELDLGGMTAEVIYFGEAHSPGDISVVIPERDVVIAGDMAFNIRMLPIFEYTDTAAWLETWPKFAEVAEGKTIIPGHGGPTDLETVEHYTKDYLTFLRTEIGRLIDEGGTLQDAYELDQSQFSHWHTFDELAGQNAGRVFQKMEFEF
ncbi:MBL fold metallo-hydrolase [Guyparkeria hydrothermalis]|uniref:MBL fold metallo-hydrolase n=1 Tax=Guyparkeria TaxID=2035712 RepID=UPI001B7FD6DB|nr:MULTISPECIES: MBL fold metallo-hydrolase [Guyparkeria]MCL7750588.1 MBL fold metallo-hydrolase [Guyparkeria hydrothermalis]